MRPEIQARLQRIEKVSTTLRIICKALLALIALLGFSCVVIVAFGVGHISYGSTVFQTGELTLGHRIILGAVTALTFGFLFKSFYHLHRLFGNYSSQRYHSELCRPAPSVWHSLSAVGSHELPLGLIARLSTNPAKSFQGHADSFTFGAIVIVIAWFMDMAVDLREENELTI